MVNTDYNNVFDKDIKRYFTESLISSIYHTKCYILSNLSDTVYLNIR